jgi:hypothetical protein
MGQAPTHPTEAMMIIQRMQLTGPAFRLSKVQRLFSWPGN